MTTLFASDLGLARLLIERGLALVYLIAFIVVIRQFVPLLGTRGLLPVPEFIALVPFRRSPSLFYLRYSDRLAQCAGWIGAALALALLLGAGDALPPPVTMLSWALLWVLYLSIVNVGQTWYGFGWETLLLEAGFLAIFLGGSGTSPPLLVIWLYRWLLFRVEFGAGLIKMRGDPCWRTLTCLDYHHETQPMPNPLSWYFHNLPRRMHRCEVVGNHVAQLVAPVLLFLPQPLASIGGAVMAVTQCWLLLSGNFSWLNALTLVITASAFDDASLHHILPVASAGAAATPAWIGALSIALLGVVALLSVRPVLNLLSPRQAMNTSFDPLHLVNSYGAFGSVTRIRREVVVEGTTDPVLGPQTEWKEYEFRGKPGDVMRRPRQFAPYHLRLDWLMWFAAISPAYAEDWFVPFVQALLRGDPATLGLMRRNPFPEAPPRYVRARMYRYRFATRAERRATGAWWAREHIGEFLRPVSGG